MRLWSIHPSYLDRMGLLGLWREALLAKSILLDENTTSSYKNHSHLQRFRVNSKVVSVKAYYIQKYLMEIYAEGVRRDYKFNNELVKHNGHLFIYYPHMLPVSISTHMGVTTGQLRFEMALLQERVEKRDPMWFNQHLSSFTHGVPIPNPIFVTTAGSVEDWEKSKLSNQKVQTA